MSKEWKLRNKEHLKKYDRKYNLKNRERIKERNKKVKEHIKNVKRKWYLKNKEAIQRQQKMYRATQILNQETSNEELHIKNSERFVNYGQR